jgi:hypothetical protein
MATQPKREKPVTDADQVLQVSGSGPNAERIGGRNHVVDYRPIYGSRYPVSRQSTPSKSQMIMAPKESISDSLGSQ